MRQALLDRVNHLPGVGLGEEALDTRPAFPLVALEDEEATRKLLALFDWYADVVSRSSPAAPLEGAEIPFATRSKFFDPVGSAVQKGRGNLSVGQAVTAQLSKKGYAGEVVAEIEKGRDAFETDWTGPDKSRFPARIKAAATVLHRQGLYGRYRIEHQRGRLEIRRLAQNRSEEKAPQPASKPGASASSPSEANASERSRSPALTEEELVLVLDAYFQIDEGAISKANPIVQELALLLRQLPIHPFGKRPTTKQFRSAGSVRSRVSQFDRIARGTNSRAPAGYVDVWERYGDAPDQLRREAWSIRRKYHASGFADGDQVASDIAEPGREEAAGADGDAAEDTALTPALELADGSRYAEAHHVRPLGSPHDGPDTRENIICVCPNCHVKLDFGAVKLRDSDAEGVGKRFVRYHNENIAGI